MKGLKQSSIALLVAGLLSAPLVQADNSASAYSKTAVIGSVAAQQGLVDPEGFSMILSSELKNSGAVKDLVIGLSYETMLFTETMVKSKGGDKSTAIADATIEMYVKVDGVEAKPGIITFDKRYQELWAKLGGVMECTDLNGDEILSFDECTLTDEEIGLILDTKQASTFNFLAYDIGSGSHTIEVWASLTHNGEVVVDPESTGSGYAGASASLGKGTLSVWEVHGSVVKGEVEEYSN